MRKATPLRAYLKPRYWPTWIIIGFMRICAILPYSWLLKIGAGLGHLLFFTLASRRNIAAKNIDLCFPELNAQARAQLQRNCFKNIGIAATETALAWWGTETQLKKLYQIEGLEHLQKAQQEKRPILLLTGHMCSTEIGARLLAFHTTFQAMYKPAKNKLFEEIMLRSRNRFYHEMVPRKKTRRLLRNLKQNIVTWYAPDQDFGHDDHVFAPFFGVSAISLTATARLVKACDAIVIPYFPYRLPNAQGYKITIGQPLENFPCGDAIKDATAINQAIEAGARLMPDQYLWLHKRFKHRPPGEARFY